MARQIIVDIVGDASKFSKATDGAVNKAEGLTRKLEKVGTGMVIGAGIASFNLLQQGISSVISSLGDMDKAYRDDLASQDRMKLAYQNTGKAQTDSIAAIEAVIKANQAKGVSDDEQRAGISDFLDKTKDTTEALKLNAATIELAAAKGIAYADAEAMIKSAAAGKTAGLQKAGVEIAKGASITEIATAVNDKFGGSLDKVAETEQGKVSIAHERQSEAMEKMGAIVDKVSMVAMPILAGAMEFAADAVTNIYNAVAPFISQLVTNLTPAVRVIGSVVGTVFSAIATYVKVAVGVMGVKLGILGTAIGVVVNLFKGIGAIVSAIFSGVVNTVKGAINFVIDIINGAIKGINKIQVHIHVGPVGYDFNGLNLGLIPRLHSGGIVPGQPGQDVFTMLQAGERVTPAGQAGGVVININGPVFGDDVFLDDLTRKIAMRLRTAG